MYNYNLDKNGNNYDSELMTHKQNDYILRMNKVKHNYLQWKRRHLPWKIGHIFHALMPPCAINWPMDTSRKNKGIPPIITNRKYGMRNAPTSQTLSFVKYCNSNKQMIQMDASVGHMGDTSQCLGFLKCFFLNFVLWCSSLACGWSDQCGSDSLCWRHHIYVWSHVWWSCCSPFCVLDCPLL